MRRGMLRAVDRVAAGWTRQGRQEWRGLWAGRDVAAGEPACGEPGTSGRHERLGWSWIRGLGAAGAAVLAGSLLAPASADGVSLISADGQRTTFYFYEKRMRERSTKEKVFQYFASVPGEPGEQPRMTAHDVLRAFVHVFAPENSTAKRSGSLAGEPRQVDKEAEEIFKKRIPKAFFQLLGKEPGTEDVTFQEFLVLYSLWSIDPDSVGAVFEIMDEDDSGFLEADELEATVKSLTENIPGAAVARPRTGLTVAQGDDGGEGYEGIKAHLFGKDHQKSITEFKAFLRGINDLLMELEFNHYDCRGTGAISARDLALSIASNADMATVQHVLSRIGSMPPELSSAKVTLEDFLAVGNVCRHYHPIVSVMKFFSSLRHLEGGFNLQRFERAVTKLTGIKLRKPIMEIFFWTLDLDDSGALHWLEVEKIMHSRSTGAYGDVSNDRASLMECMRNCVKNVRAA